MYLRLCVSKEQKDIRAQDQKSYSAKLKAKKFFVLVTFCTYVHIFEKYLQNIWRFTNFSFYLRHEKNHHISRCFYF